jgi:hypothetical protein
MAKRKQLDEMDWTGKAFEPEPNVVIVTTYGGRVLRWLRVFGGDLYRLCASHDSTIVD